MAVPKKRTSKSKKNKRKLVWKRKAIEKGLKVPTTLFIYETKVLTRKERPKGFS